MSIKGGTTREMMLKRIVEDEEIEDKKQDAGKHHGSTHHKTRKNKMDADKAEADKKAKEAKEKQGSMDDVKQMDTEKVQALFNALKVSHKAKAPTTEFEGKVYDTAIIGAVDDHLVSLKDSGGGKGGGTKYTVAYTKWVEQQFQKDIKAGTPIAKIQSDAKVQQSYQKTSGQSPIAK